MTQIKSFCSPILQRIRIKDFRMGLLLSCVLQILNKSRFSNSKLSSTKTFTTTSIKLLGKVTKKKSSLVAIMVSSYFLIWALLLTEYSREKRKVVKDFLLISKQECLVNKVLLLILVLT